MSPHEENATASLQSADRLGAMTFNMKGCAADGRA